MVVITDHKFCITLLLGDLLPFSKSHLLVSATLDTFDRFPVAGDGVAGLSPPNTLLPVLEPNALLLMLDANELWPVVLAPSGLRTFTADCLFPCMAFWRRGLTGEGEYGCALLRLLPGLPLWAVEPPAVLMLAGVPAIDGVLEYLGGVLMEGPPGTAFAIDGSPRSFLWEGVRGMSERSSAGRKSGRSATMMLKRGMRRTA